jgi:hypothetical protein
MGSLPACRGEAVVEDISLVSEEKRYTARHFDQLILLTEPSGVEYHTKEEVV